MPGISSIPRNTRRLVDERVYSNEGSMKSSPARVSTPCPSGTAATRCSGGSLGGGASPTGASGSATVSLPGPGSAGPGPIPCPPIFWPIPVPRKRSEEHTSELQSLMRISYAVFCLKKITYYSYSYITPIFTVSSTHYTTTVTHTCKLQSLIRHSITVL